MPRGTREARRPQERRPAHVHSRRAARVRLVGRGGRRRFVRCPAARARAVAPGTRRRGNHLARRRFRARDRRRRLRGAQRPGRREYGHRRARRRRLPPVPRGARNRLPRDRRDAHARRPHRERVRGAGLGAWRRKELRRGGSVSVVPALFRADASRPRRRRRRRRRRGADERGKKKSGSDESWAAEALATLSRGEELIVVGTDASFFQKHPRVLSFLRENAFREAPPGAVDTYGTVWTSPRVAAATRRGKGEKPPSPSREARFDLARLEFEPGAFTNEAETIAQYLTPRRVFLTACEVAFAAVFFPGVVALAFSGNEKKKKTR